MAIDEKNTNFGYFGHGEIAIQVTRDDGPFDIETREAEILIARALSFSLNRIISGENDSFQTVIDQQCGNVNDPIATHLSQFGRDGQKLLSNYLPPSLENSLLGRKLAEYEKCGVAQISYDQKNGLLPEATAYLQVLNVGLDYQVDKIEIDRALLYLVGELRIKLTQLDKVEGMDGLRFTVCPNWRFTAAPGGLGSGGPGKKPVKTNAPKSGLDSGFQPIDPEKIKALLNNDDLATNRLEQFTQAFNNANVEAEDPNGINVYILDTLPSAKQLWWAASEASNLNNRAITSLFGWLNPDNEQKSQSTKGGNLEITNEGQGQIKSLTYLYHPQDRDFIDPYYHLKNRHEQLEHPYDMSSHGPFIANTIRMLAPSAKLNLIRVLNDQGIGSLCTIQSGLKKVLTQEQGNSKPYIVNLSLTIGFNCDTPLPNENDEQGQTLKDICALIDLLGESEVNGVDFDFLNIPRTLFSRFTQGSVIAAAGNDSLPETTVQTGYPALFPNIIGVGALGSNLKRAPYSNQADVAETTGFWAFGGDPASESSIYSHSKCGFLSIYTSKTFPNKSGPAIKNENGWGRWAGTSFATPVIAGAFARLLGNGLNHDQVLTALSAFTTADGELGGFPLVPLEQVECCDCPTPDPDAPGCLAALIDLFRVDNVLTTNRDY